MHNVLVLLDRDLGGGVYAAARRAAEGEPLNAAALNAAGLAAEARGDLSSAAAAFRSAAQLSAAPRGVRILSQWR